MITCGLTIDLVGVVVPKLQHCTVNEPLSIDQGG